MRLQYIYTFQVTQNLTKKNNKKYNKKKGINKPFTCKQGQRDFDLKDYYELWTNEIFQLLPGTTYYLGLHRPTIKGLKWTNMTIVDKLQNNWCKQ